MKKDNKGFSLVELIIVIAIMAILVGVLAPTFIKYVEQSRRSTDITNAEEIRTAIEADLADGNITGSHNGTTLNSWGTDGYTKPTASGAAAIEISSIENIPTVRGSLVTGSTAVFTADYDATTGVVNVKIGGYNLSDPKHAEAYKAGDAVPGTTGP